MRDLRRAGQLALGVLGLLLAVCFAVLPVERQVVYYDWNAEVDGTSAPLVLTERTPHVFELTFPCSAALAGDTLLFASSRDVDAVRVLTVVATGGSLRVELPGPDGTSGVQLDLALEEASCETVNLRYERDLGQLSVDTGTDRVVRDNLESDAFVLTGLHWSGPTAGAGATVVTEPQTQVRNSLPQRLVLLAIVLLAGLSITWSLVERRGVSSERAQPSRRPLDRWDWAMLGAATVVMLVDLFRTDDGGILARARLQSASLFTSNLSTMVEGRALPQRAVYEYLLGVSVGWSEVILILRLPSLAAGVGSWLLFRRYVLPKLVSDPTSPAVLASTWGIHALFVVAWFATLRPEPFLILLSVGVMSVMAAWPARVRAWPYILVIGLAGLALATHVTGLMAAALGVGVLPRSVRELRSQPARVVQGWVWGGAVALLALVVGGNLKFIYEGATSFRAGTAHSNRFIDSLSYIDSLSTGTAPMITSMMAVAIGFIVLLVAIASPRREGRDAATRWLLIGAMLTPVALLLTPSKWAWHLATLLPVALIGIATLVSAIERRPRGLWVSGVAATAGGFAIATALTLARFDRTPGSRFRDLVLRNVSADAWADRLPLLVGEDTQAWLWVSIFLLAIVPAVVALRGRKAHLGAVSTSLSILLVAGIASMMQLLVPIMDAVRADAGDWTFVGQSVGGLFSSDLACGVAYATPAVSDWIEANPDRASAIKEGRGTGPRQATMMLTCHEPVGQVNGVWQRPDLVLERVFNRNAQRRLLHEFTLEEIGCNPTPRNPSDGICFFTVSPAIDEMGPDLIEWRIRER